MDATELATAAASRDATYKRLAARVTAMRRASNVSELAQYDQGRYYWPELDVATRAAHVAWRDAAIAAGADPKRIAK